MKLFGFASTSRGDPGDVRPSATAAFVFWLLNRAEARSASSASAMCPTLWRLPA